jgi:hypothetical protein
MVVFGHGRLLVVPRVGEEATIAAISAPESSPESPALVDEATGAAGA